MEQTPNTKTPDLMDTTDCLEAIDAIRWMKNFLYIIILLCLFVSGTVFCLDRTDHINRAGCTTCGICPTGPCNSVCKAAQQIEAPADANTVSKIRAAAQAVVSGTQPAELRKPPLIRMPKPPDRCRRCSVINRAVRTWLSH